MLIIGKNGRDIIHINKDESQLDITKIGNSFYIKSTNNEIFEIRNLEDSDLLILNSSRIPKIIKPDYQGDTNIEEYFPLSSLNDLKSYSDRYIFTAFGTVSEVTLSNGMRGIQVSSDDLSSTGYLQLGSDNLNFSTFAISFWVEYIKSDADSSIIFNYESDYELSVDYSDNYLKWAVHNNNSDGSNWTWIKENIEMSGLKHIVYQYNGSSTEIWINGVKIVEHDHDRSPYSDDRNNAFTIGGRAPSFGESTGSISALKVSDFIISDTPLSTDLINEIYTKGINGKRFLD